MLMVVTTNGAQSSTFLNLTVFSFLLIQTKKTQYKLNCVLLSVTPLVHTEEAN